MGWLNNTINWFSRGVGKAAEYAKKIGEFVTPIARRIGEWAPLVGNIAGTAIDGIGLATGQGAWAVPLGESVRMGGNWLGTLGSKVADYGDIATNVAGNMHQSLSKFNGGAG